jgi:hypothetical protein
MGGGSWASTGHSYYSASSKLSKSARSVKEVFRESRINQALDPKGVLLRESCDSQDNPSSNAIILALDVTGSMGAIAHDIASNGLGKLIEGIFDRKPVVDPHIMFMAVGDAYYDSAPLQVSQFECDHRIVEQLQQIFVEQGGGGNSFESYDLPWYFAGTRTSIDCFEKRQQKGYIFTMGDESVPDGHTAAQRERIFGNKDQRDFVTAKESLELAEAKYNVFHLIIEEGSRMHSYEKTEITSAWKQLLGKRAIFVNNYKYLSEIILSVMDVQEGANPEDVIASWQDSSIQNTVAHALGV